jgi:hypothetical protein
LSPRPASGRDNQSSNTVETLDSEFHRYTASQSASELSERQRSVFDWLEKGGLRSGAA